MQRKVDFDNYNFFHHVFKAFRRMQKFFAILFDMPTLTIYKKMWLLLKKYIDALINPKEV